MINPMWRLPISGMHHLAGSAGALSFVGGAGDLDDTGKIRSPNDLDQQIAGAIRNLESALEIESCSLDDVVRIKAFYLSDGTVNEWQVKAAIANEFKENPLPVISTLPVPLQPFNHQKVQIQAIAQRNWRTEKDVRITTSSIPEVERRRFSVNELTDGLRANEFIAIANRTATDMNDTVANPSDGPAQTHSIMQSIENTLATLGASFQDAIKKEGYYFGTTRDQWASMAKVRASYFREPGPVATVVPAHVLYPIDAVTKIEVLAMRQTRGGFDKYIPREDWWPERVWDWPIPLPYRQSSRLRNMIWLGGQVPYATHSNKPGRVLDGELDLQTTFTMSYIEDLLRGFNRSPVDLKLCVCYFTSNGSQAETEAFVRVLQNCIGGALPPLTLVPVPHMHTPETTVEIWGVAQG